MKVSRWIALAVVTLAPRLVAQSAEAPNALAEALRTECAKFRDEHAIVGLGVAVIQRGEVVFDGAFGERDREAKQPAETSTLYRLASVSKPVTAVVAMQLVEAGKLELDAGVAKYVGGLEPRVGALTLRQLLSHTSGVRHYRDDRTDNGTAHRTTREALELFARDPFVADPGTKYSYSTHAFTLAVAAIEGASKSEFQALLRDNVSKKCAAALDCEVVSESKSVRSALYEKLPVGVVRRSEPREDLSWKYGGGGLESTAADLARFASAVWSSKLVSPSSRDALWTRTKLADGSSVDYGLGWTVGEKAKLASHSGSQQGASSSLSIVVESGLVVAILSNTQGGGASDLAPRLREIAAKSK